MVCKECGAYNADHLTHCRVCAAKLKDTEPDTAQTAQEPGRPARRFAQAPAWPKQAFAGAEESQTAAAPAAAQKTDEPAKAEPAQEQPAEKRQPVAQQPRPEAQPTAAPAEPAAPKVVERPAAKPVEKQQSVCAHCGKPLLPDAPFCAYCGTPVGSAASAQNAAPVRTEETAAAAGTAARRFSKRPEKAPEPVKDDYADLYAEDEDDFDDEYDDDLYDDEEEPAGKGKGGKGSTILFWGLIVVLVALILGLGWLFISKNGGFDSVIGKWFGGDAATTTPGTADGDSTPDPNAVISTNGMSASIEPATLNNGGEGFLITVNAPNGSVLHIITDAALDSDRVTISQDNAVKVMVPKEVFLPGDYADTETVSVTPQLEIISPDGTTTPLQVPAVSITLQPLTLTITEPATLSAEQKPDNGAITVKGTVDDHTVEVYVNDNPVPVYEGGQFQTEVTPEVDPENGGEIVVTAKKKNRVTATQTIAVTPYVVKDLAMAITTEVNDLRAEKDGVVVNGTVTTGATVKVTSDSDKVTCGETIVTATGTFSCPVTITEDGFYTLTVTGTLEGYNESKLTCYVERVPGSSSAFKGKCTDISKLYGKLVDGSTTSANIVLKGKIKEIVSTTPYTIVKVELSDGKEVMVCNRSLKNTLAEDDIGRTKEIAGVYAGLYPDTELPYVWGWFIWNK